VTFGADARVTVTVSAAGATPTGRVTLTVDGTSLAPQPLVNGATVFTLPALSAGTHSLAANYPAQDSFAASAATGTLQVNLYTFSGFFPPIPNSNFNRGRTIPVKFSLKNSSGAFVSTCKCTLTVQKLTGKGGALTGNPIPATPSTGSGNTFVYNASANQYQYNMNTDPLSRGWWRLQAHLDDGTIQTVDIQIQ
jgi:hypothetical protein